MCKIDREVCEMFHRDLLNLRRTVLGIAFLMKPSNSTEIGPTKNVSQGLLAILRIKYMKNTADGFMFFIRKQCIEK